MDIDHLKKSWKKRSSAISEDSSLDEATLKSIMGRQYKNLFLQILIPELMITAAYGFLILFLVVFFRFFNEFWLQGLAILAIGLLVAIPALSLTTFYRYYNSGKPTMAVKNTLAESKKYGQLFLRTQYNLLLLNLFLLADLIALVPLVYSEHLSTKQQVITIVIGSSLVLLISSFLWKYYKKKINRINAFISQI
jgi:glucan phosphoethanolaminetransferase (alkaline phosphatase superfamily)